MKIKNVGIIGVGFVGDAIHNHLITQKRLKVFVYDKYKKMGDLDEVIANSQMIYLCLPTPYDEKLNNYDLSSLHVVCQQLKDKKYEHNVLIKSTVTPGVSEELAEKYDLKIIHNPEFLTARTSRKDFRETQHVVLGKTSKTSTKDVYRYYKKLFPKAKITRCSSGEAEILKIGVNSFYATKIQYFNEIYLLCQNKELSYKKVKKMMLRNGWIKDFHMDVPGHDGQLSFGGACFPKDTRALLAYYQRENIEHSVLAGVVQGNKNLRKDAK